MLATAKFGLAPEMIELADIVNASPELLEVIFGDEIDRIRWTFAGDPCTGW